MEGQSVATGWTMHGSRFETHPPYVWSIRSYLAEMHGAKNWNWYSMPQKHPDRQPLTGKSTPGFG